MRKLYAQFDMAQAKKEAEASKQAAEIMKGRYGAAFVMLSAYFVLVPFQHGCCDAFCS